MAVGAHVSRSFEFKGKHCWICDSIINEEVERLSCHHLCCKRCVAINSYQDKTIYCPVCHTGGENSKVDDLKEQPINVNCGSCSDTTCPAVTYCNQCNQNICQKCIESHKRMKIFEGHGLVPVRPHTSSLALDFYKCKHHGFPLILFCFDCLSLACHLCVGSVHSDHKFKFCAAASPKSRRDLEGKVSLLDKLLKELEDAVTDQRIAQEEVMANGLHTALTINVYFDKLHQTLDKQKEDLLTVVGSKVRKKTQDIAQQLEELNKSSQELNSVMKYTEQCIENCTDNEIVAFHSHLTHNVELSIEKTPGLKSGHPVSFFGLDMKMFEDFETLCRDVATLTQVCVDPKKCTITGTGLNEAEVDNVSALFLNIHLSNGKHTKCRPQVEAQLKSIHSNTITQCSIKRTELGQFCVQYVPKDRGLHSFSVLVNGKEMPYSPYFVLASLSPSQLCKPITVLSQCVSNPTAISANSAGEIVVAEFEGDIVTLDHSGKELRRLKHKKHGFQELSGLTMDEDSNLYFVDLLSSKIYKSNQNSTNVQKKNVNQTHGPGHCGLAVSQSELLVCECHNEGTIQIYNKKDMTWSRTVQTKGMGLFLDVAVDSTGNIYAVDNTNSCIQVIDKQGYFLRSIKHDSNGMLTCPRNVCVTGQHVYVSDWVDTKITVYTLEGEYVTSFGSGSDLGGPQGLYVDSNGFIYVCDLQLSTIEIY